MNGSLNRAGSTQLRGSRQTVEVYERRFSRKLGSHHLTGCGSFALEMRGARGNFRAAGFGFAAAANGGTAAGGKAGGSDTAKRACKVSSAA